MKVLNKIILLILISSWFFSYHIKQSNKHKLSLFLTESDINRLADSKTPDHFLNHHYKQLKAEMDSMLTETINIPDRGGNWPHYYVDPEEGDRLITGKKIGPFQWEHYNSDCTKVYYGNPDIPARDYDGVVIQQRIHHGYVNALFGAALLYQLDQDDKYLHYANEILGQYIEKYPQYPYRNKDHEPDNNTGTGLGKVTVQALGESVWLIKVLQGLDLLWEYFNEKEKAAIEKNILWPAMSCITINKLGVHNIQCWNNAAIGLTGYLISDDNLINLAVHDEDNGFIKNLEDGLTPEGLWYERSPSYHFYALRPIHILAEALKNNDHEINQDIKKLFDAPIVFSPPDGDMPRLNDARPVNLPDFKNLYYYAWSRFKDSTYLKILKTPEKKQNKYFNYEWFFAENDYQPQKLQLPSKTGSYPETGFDILRKGKMWTLVKYDRQGGLGWHAHPDALSFVTWYDGDYTAIDPGHAEYGALAHRHWYKTTLSHSTLYVDNRDQKEVGGDLLKSGIEQDIPYVQLKADSIYENLTFYRTVCLPGENMMLIADAVVADSSKLMEIAYHPRGDFMNNHGKPTDLKDGYPYRFIDHPHTLAESDQFNFAVSYKNTDQHITIKSDKNVKAYYGTGPGMDFEETPVIVLKNNAKIWNLYWLIVYGPDKYDLKIDEQNLEIIGKKDQQTINSFRISPEDGLFKVVL